MREIAIFEIWISSKNPRVVIGANERKKPQGAIDRLYSVPLRPSSISALTRRPLLNTSLTTPKMAAMMTAAPVCIRASTTTSTRKARGVSSRVVAPAALRRSAVSAGRRANSLVVSNPLRNHTRTRTRAPRRNPLFPFSSAKDTRLAAVHLEQRRACHANHLFLPHPTVEIRMAFYPFRVGWASHGAPRSSAVTQTQTLPLPSSLPLLVCLPLSLSYLATIF